MVKNDLAIVIGAGIAGPASALFLKKAGFKPMVFEGRDHSANIGGGLQIAPNGMCVLRQLGVASELRKAGVESAEFCFENQFGKKLACIPNGPSSKYEHPAVQVSRSLLHRLLLDELERQEIPIFYSKRLQSATSDEDRVVAEFEDGSVAEAKILVGADGIHSQTRRITFPESPVPTYTGLVTVGGFAENDSLTPVEESHLKRAHLIFGQNGFFGYGYYDPSKPSAVMWWSHLQRSEGEVDCLDTEELRARMFAHHANWAEPVGTILQNTTRLLSGPIDDLPNLPDWSKGRIVLVGDAAHAVSPHAGQGASLALEDAICLANHLRKLEFGDAFSAYQKERQPRVEKIVAEARKRGEGKHALPPNAAKIRDFILSAFLKLKGKHLFDEAYQFKSVWD